MISWKSEAGKRPNKHLLQEAAMFAKPGSHAHTVIAMAMRPNGLTQKEVIILLGHPCRNKLKQLVLDKKVEQYTLPEDSRAKRIRLVPIRK